MYRLCNPKPPEPIVLLDKNESRTSSFGTPTTTERAPLVGIIPEYPPRGAPHRPPAHRPSVSVSSLSSGMSPVSPTSPVSVAKFSPSTPYIPHQWPTRLPPAGIYAAYADANPIPTQSYWSDDVAIARPENASLEMDRSTPYRYRQDTSLELERLITPPSPTTHTLVGSAVSLDMAYDQESIAPMSPVSPVRPSNPPPAPAYPRVRRVQVPPYDEPGNGGFGASQAAHQRSVSSPTASLLEKEYLAASYKAARPLSHVETQSQVSTYSEAPPSPSYPPEKYPPEKTPSAPSTPKTRRQFQIYGTGYPPVPSSPQRVADEAHEQELIDRVRHKLDMERERREHAGTGRAAVEGQAEGRTGRWITQGVPAREAVHPAFGYASDSAPPRPKGKLPKPISPGEALAMPLPRPEWYPRVEGSDFRV